MLVIRLQRIGRKHQPSYRVVVAEKRSKLQGPPVDDFGFYDPFTKHFEVKKDRIEHWLSKGAQPTTTIYNLLVKNKVVNGMPVPVKMRKSKVQPPREAVPAQTQAEVNAS